MSTFSVLPLTCSALDAVWFMSLPEVIDPEIQTVKIRMQPDLEAGLFVYSEDTKAVFLNQTMRFEVLSGAFCPKKQNVSLTFELESDLYLPSTQNLTIHIEPRNYTAFEGVKTPKDFDFTV